MPSLLIDLALPEHLDNLIARRGLSAEAFCRTAHLDPKTYRKIKAGAAVRPSTVSRVRRALEKLPELGSIEVVEQAS